MFVIDAALGCVNVKAKQQMTKNTPRLTGTVRIQ